MLQAKVEKAKVPIEKGLANIQQNLAKHEEERHLLEEKINQKLNAAETSKYCNYVCFHDFDFYMIFRSARTIRAFNGKTQRT